MPSPSQSPSPAPDGGADAAAPAKGSPSDFLKHVIGKRVVVRLTSGIDYKGILTCLDGYMNIALEDCAEWVGTQRRGVYGDAFVRGNNVLYITAA